MFYIVGTAFYKELFWFEICVKLLHSNVAGNQSAFIRDDATRWIVSRVWEKDIHVASKDIIYLDIVKKVHFLKVLWRKTLFLYFIKITKITFLFGKEYNDEVILSGRHNGKTVYLRIMHIDYSIYIAKVPGMTEE